MSVAETSIREAGPADGAGVAELYPQAFPDEELRPLIERLIAEADVVSLVATRGGRIAGHALFTLFAAGSGVLLGPLAVAPAARRRGLGKALVAEGLARLAARGARQVFVLGDPAYYVRSGFAPETRVAPPYALPEEWVGAWQSLTLAGAAPLPPGPIRLPAPWMEPRLWAP